VPYWLDTQDAFNIFRVTRNWEGYDRDLAAKMSDIVIAFAKTGNPSTKAVQMIRYNAADEQLVDFGDSVKVVKLNTAGLDFIANTPAISTGRGGRGGRGALPAGGVAKYRIP